MNDDQALPPLESDDPAWVAGRWREFAEGRGPRTGRRARFSASALKQFRLEAALTDVLCKGRMIARVFEGERGMEVVTEVMEVPGGGGYGYTAFRLADQFVVAVACRCGHEHRLRCDLLAVHAARQKPGAPRTTSVSATSLT